ncbi:MAG: amidohydrolase [Spirochaetaceae bacterium]|nr:MAG: amidohydrolase [Spirochaetaceae bacterium]
MRIIDFHTHAFPDTVADKAVPLLEHEADTKAFHDGKISSLLASMDRAGIEKAVVCSISTKPSQFTPILQWSLDIKSDRLVPLASVHPEDPDLVAHIHAVKQAGLLGIKMHPYYQCYSVNESRMDPFYQALEETGLFLVCHTGFDIAFPHDRIADPEKIVDVIKRFPKLRFITTHLGAWKDWEEVEKHIIGRPILMEISYTLGILDDASAVRLLLKHPSDYIIFGTDSPWDDQKMAVDRFMALRIPDKIKEKVMFKNPARLLGLL